MKSIVANSCLVKPSQLGAKGFFYPIDDAAGIFIKKGTEVDELNFVSTEKYTGWKAIAVANELVEGAVTPSGTGVYWIQRKNLQE